VSLEGTKLPPPPIKALAMKLGSQACSHAADHDVTEKHDFVLRNILSQNKHTKVKKCLLLTNEEEKTEKRQKIVKIHFRVDGCYGNVIHHRHVIDTGKFSLINFRKSQEIW